MPLQEKGWQEALEALAFDLKINRLRVRDGDVTYVDRGPFKPLHLSALQLSAENIRNIRSPERVYPSELHLAATVFEGGRLWVDGYADFLAEPHVGVEAAVKLEQIQLDYFKPITNRYNVGVRNGRLSLAGSFEYAPKITRLVLDRVLVQGVEIEYIHSARTAAVEKARARETAQAAKQVANRPSVELAIERLDIVSIWATSGARGRPSPASEAGSWAAGRRTSRPPYNPRRAAPTSISRRRSSASIWPA